MSYIRNPGHFINYLNKALREADNAPAHNLLLPAAFYIQLIYDEGIADEFTWDLKQTGIQLLERDNVLDWLSKHKRTTLPEFSFTHSFTPEFLHTIEKLENTPGVYSFWFRERPLYIGKSINLGQRIIGSFAGRFDNFNQIIHLRYITATTPTDASILEIHFINLLKPPYNKEYNTDPKQHRLTISPMPEWSEPIQCNTIKEKTDNETLPAGSGRD